ncbi:hypothetical protein PC116_g8938 [Phytophthora cactorum]|nr:hypothetical protein PC116_g8938 [Phytophthora cactorum]
MLLVGSATAGQAGASAGVDAGSDVLAMAAKMLLSVDAYADEVSKLSLVAWISWLRQVDRDGQTAARRGVVAAGGNKLAVFARLLLSLVRTRWSVVQMLPAKLSVLAQTSSS